MAETKQTNRTVTLERLARRGAFRVDLEGESHTAPFSRRSCIWSDWIYNTAEISSDNGFHYGERQGGSFLVKTEFGALEIDSRRIQPYVNASFQGKVIWNCRELVVIEYCLEPGRHYFALVETLTHFLPGFRIIPFLHRRRTALRLALSDCAFVDGKPGLPLVPTFRGLTWDGRDSRS